MRASTLLARSLALATSAALLACVPDPGGRCQTSADCTVPGLVCIDALCQAARPDVCSPACASGLHCDNGSCALDAAPLVEWTSPGDGSGASSGMVALSLSISTPATDVRASIQLATRVPSDTPAVIPLARGSDGLYTGLVDAGALAERDWTMTPILEAAGAQWGGPARRLRVDRTGPRVELMLPLPRGGNFLRTETVEVRAHVIDDGVGLGSGAALPALVAAGMSDLSGTRISETEWSFQLPLSAPTFAMATGALLLSLRASDALGNQTLSPFTLPVTRAIWTASVGNGLPIRSSPAIDAHHLFIGTDSAQLVALDRATAAPLWTRDLDGPISASPALGLHGLYVASEGGQVRALAPDTGAVLWSCAELPAGLSFLSSPAIVPLAGLSAGGAGAEAIALANTGSFQAATSAGATAISGGLLLLEGSAGFSREDGTRSCYLAAPVSGGRSSPAVDLDNTIYAGGDDGHAHALQLSFDPGGAASLVERWSVAATDDVSASPALGAAGIAFADESGSVFWLDKNGAALAPTQTLADKIFSSPVFGGDTLLSLDRSGALSPFATQAPSTPPLALAPPIFQPFAIPGVADVQSTPAVGSDGTLYIAAGRALYAYAPGGLLRWSFPLVGSATASSPTLACDGTLYVGDSSGSVLAIATDSRGLMPGWSRFHHDARNSGNAGMGGCE